MHELNPIQWAFLPLRKYAVFSGRSPRAEYWWYALVFGIAGFGLGILDVTLIGPPIIGGYGPLGLAFVLAMASPGIAVTVRRLHDIERSGWWCLIRLIGLAVGLTGPAKLAQIGSLDQPLFGIAVVAIVAWICLAFTLFLFMITPGTEDRNEYGPDPYGADQLEQVFA